MTTPGQPGYPFPPGDPRAFTDPQSYVDPAQALTAQEAQKAAAESIAAQAAATAGGDAAEMADQVRQQIVREVLLPMEQQMQSMMDDWRKQTDAQAAQIKTLQMQLAGAQAVMGPPAVQKYAQAVAERLQAAANSSGLPKDHWAGALGSAQALVAEVDKALGSGDATGIGPIIGDVERFVTRTHPRLSNVHIEHFPALLGDLEELGLAAGKLVAAVA